VDLSIDAEKEPNRSIAQLIQGWVEVIADISFQSSKVNLRVTESATTRKFENIWCVKIRHIIDAVKGEERQLGRV
jgi:hypothetical protein